MGIKTPLTLEELCTVFPCSVLIPSTHGVSDTVYLTDRGVLKLYETASAETVREEHALLDHLSSLNIARPIGKLFSLRGKPCALYERLEGTSLSHARPEHIVQIAAFLNRFHTLSSGLTSSNTRLFERDRLQSLITQSVNPELQTLFEGIGLELSNDGVIHGDLFLDNALFDHDTLSGVLDFSEACEGDFLFDLAVVAVSWCLEGPDAYANVNLLLQCYGHDVGWDDFLPYMKYALLYYATTRYLGGRDHQALLQKIPLLDTLRKGEA